MAEAPSKHNTGAVLVAFNPDREVIDRLMAMRDQVDLALVVDNTPPENRQPWLSDTSSALGVELISNEENVGVAAALNQGIEWATGRGLKWLLTLDQDSGIYPEMLPTLGLVYEDYPSKDRLAMIGSNYVERAWKQPFWQGETKGPQDWTEVVFLITSGSLVSLEALEAVGGFREELFIDLVDTEFCLRARSKQYHLIMSKRPLMDHGIGEPAWCKLLWKRLTTANHSPSRHYYFTRNHLTLMREYWPTERSAMASTIKPRLKEIVLVMCCERGRWRKFAAMVMGAWDAMTGRLGRKD